MIKQSFATWKQRLIAYFLDLLLIALYGILLLWMNWLFAFPLTSFLTHSPMIAQIVGFCCITLPVFIYFFIFEYKRKATLGKKWIKLEIVSDDQALYMHQVLVRTIVKLLPWELSHFVIWRFQLPTTLPDGVLYLLLALVYVVMFTNLLLVLKTKNKQALHDLVAQTYVKRRINS